MQVKMVLFHDEIKYAKYRKFVVQKTKILEIGFTKYAIQVIWITYKVKKIKIKSKHMKKGPIIYSKIVHLYLSNNFKLWKKIKEFEINTILSSKLWQI